MKAVAAQDGPVAHCSAKNIAEAKRRGRSSVAGRFLRIDDVIATTGLSRSTIYRLVASNEFPRQHALTKRCIGWWESDVEAWLRSRLAGCPQSD